MNRTTARGLLVSLLGLWVLAASAPCADTDRKAVTEAKLARIVLPSVDVTDASVADFFQLLSDIIRESDPEPDERLKGVNFFLNLDPEEAAKTLSYTGTNRSVRDVINAVCRDAGFSVLVKDNVVWINSAVREKRLMESRTYLISAERAPDLIKEGARKYLESRGVAFPAGATCSYVRGNSQLFVNNTPSNLKIVERVLADPPGPAAPRAETAGRADPGKATPGAEAPPGSRDSRRLQGDPWDGKDKDRLRGGPAPSAARENQAAARAEYQKERETLKSIDGIQRQAGTRTPLETRLDGIVIPELDLQGLTLKEALGLLQELGRGSDSPTEFQIVLKASPQQAALPIPMFRASNISVMQALRAVVGAAGLSFRVQGENLVVYGPAAKQEPKKP